MGGPGYSDEVSVISEMSTPTVMTRQHVKDWEHYREVNRGRRKPLGLVGGGVSRPSPGGGKSRNALNRVRSSGPLPSPMSSGGSGGAAAQRRRTYAKTMTKLQEEGFDAELLEGDPFKSPTKHATNNNKTETTANNNNKNDDLLFGGRDPFLSPETQTQFFADTFGTTVPTMNTPFETPSGNSDNKKVVKRKKYKNGARRPSVTDQSAMTDNQSHGSHGADISVRTPTTLTTTGTNSYVNSPASQTFVTAMESFAEDDDGNGVNSSGWPMAPSNTTPPPSSP